VFKQKRIFLVFLMGVLACLFETACSKRVDYGRLAMQYRQECFGDMTVECRDMQIRLAVAAEKVNLETLKNDSIKYVQCRGKEDYNELQSLIKGHIDHLEGLRPGFFMRHFSSSAQIELPHDDFPGGTRMEDLKRHACRAQDAPPQDNTTNDTRRSVPASEPTPHLATGIDLSIPQINSRQDDNADGSRTQSTQTSAVNKTEPEAQGRQAETRFGRLSINEYSQLVFNGHLVRPGIQANGSLSIKESFNLNGEEIVIIENTGGTACPALLNLVVISADGARSYPTFGTCSDIYRAQVSGSSIVVQMQDADNVSHKYIFADHVLTDNGKKIELPPARDFAFEAVIEDADGYTNIRSQPNGQSQIIGRIENGESFQTHPQDGTWWKVKMADGSLGFIHRSRIVLLQTRF
jgi:hypothetical protein